MFLAFIGFTIVFLLTWQFSWLAEFKTAGGGSKTFHTEGTQFDA